jgi:hypothetical protein
MRRPLLRALIRRRASSHRQRPSAATSSRFGLHLCSCSCRPSSCAAAFNCRFRSLPPGRLSSFSSIAFAARTNRASSSRQIGQIMNVLRRLSRRYWRVSSRVVENEPRDTFLPEIPYRAPRPDLTLLTMSSRLEVRIRLLTDRAIVAMTQEELHAI